MIQLYSCVVPVWWHLYLHIEVINISKFLLNSQWPGSSRNSCWRAYSLCLSISITEAVSGWRSFSLSKWTTNPLDLLFTCCTLYDCEVCFTTLCGPIQQQSTYHEPHVDSAARLVFQPCVVFGCKSQLVQWKNWTPESSVLWMIEAILSFICHLHLPVPTYHVRSSELLGTCQGVQHITYVKKHLTSLQHWLFCD